MQSNMAKESIGYERYLQKVLKPYICIHLLNSYNAFQQ